MIEAVLLSVAVLVAAHGLRPRPSVRPLAQVASSRSLQPKSLRWRRRGSPRVEPGDVASWCESLARVVRSGSTLTAAVRTVEAPPTIALAVDQIVLRLDRGRRLVDAVATSSTSPHLNVAFTVLRACATQGGPPAEPLDRAAATLRGRAADVAERQMYSAQARLSAIVMTVLPVGMLGVLLLTSGSTRSAVTTPTGLAAITTGGVLNLLGWRWMRRIIDGVSS